MAMGSLERLGEVIKEELLAERPLPSKRTKVQSSSRKLTGSSSVGAGLSAANKESLLHNGINVGDIFCGVECDQSVLNFLENLSSKRGLDKTKSKILDFTCRRLSLLISLHEHNFKQLFAADSDIRNIEYTKKMILPASIEVIQLDSADLEGLVAKEKLSNLAPFHIIHDATLVDSCRDVASTSNDAKEKLKNLLAQIHSIMAIDGRLIVRSFYWKLNEVGVLFEGLFQLEANLTNMPLPGKDQLNVFVLRKHQA